MKQGLRRAEAAGLGENGQPPRPALGDGEGQAGFELAQDAEAGDAPRVEDGSLPSPDLDIGVERARTEMSEKRC